jgi:uncharacterized membrane protein
MKIAAKLENHIGPILYITIKNRTFGFCLCHRKKDRSFHFLGLENFLCSRCLGSLIGGLCAIILGFQGYVFPIFWSIIFVIPLIFDGLSQIFYNRESTNTIRFITGLLSGWGIVFIGIYFGSFTSSFFEKGS